MARAASAASVAGTARAAARDSGHGAQRTQWGADSEERAGRRQCNNNIRRQQAEQQQQHDVVQKQQQQRRLLGGRNDHVDGGVHDQHEERAADEHTLLPQLEQEVGAQLVGALHDEFAAARDERVAVGDAANDAVEALVDGHARRPRQ